MMELSNTAAPAATGDATDVPESARQPSPTLLPQIPSPYVTISGFTRPYPLGSSIVVIPRELKCAMASASVMPPTPMMSKLSAGLFNVPYSGPSFPIALIMMIPAAVISLILSVNGRSR